MLLLGGVPADRGYSSVQADPPGEYARAAGSLWIAPQPIAWTKTSAWHKAEFSVYGGPADAECHVIIQIPYRHQGLTALASRLSVIWRGQRVRGLDLAEPSHKDSRGRTVPTPHRLCYDAQGRERVGPVDLHQESISTEEQALRWLLRWCGIQWHGMWVDPPP